MCVFKSIEFNKIYESELIVKRSRFISVCMCVRDKEHVKKILSEYKKKYCDAKHVCYGFKLMGDEKKYSDDGEPGGSAGKKILDVIENKDLICVLVIVIRYFGGVLLGVGNLSRAYYEASKLVLDKIKVIEFKNYIECEIKIGFSDFNKLIKFLNYNQAFIKEIFYLGLEIKIRFLILKNKLDLIFREINNLFRYNNKSGDKEFEFEFNKSSDKKIIGCLDLDNKKFFMITGEIFDSGL